MDRVIIFSARRRRRALLQKLLHTLVGGSATVRQGRQRRPRGGRARRFDGVVSGDSCRVKAPGEVGAAALTNGREDLAQTRVEGLFRRSVGLSIRKRDGRSTGEEARPRAAVVPEAIIIFRCDEGGPQY